MSLPLNWTTVGIEETLLPFHNGQTLRQGWSPQCERFPAQSESDWGVLKTTAIQDGEFQQQHNKQLPPSLEPDPLLEVEEGDLLLTCAGPRVRCGVICLVRTTRKRLMISGKMYRFRVDSRIALPAYLEAFLRSHDTKKRIDEMKTGISDSGLNLTLSRFKTLQVPLPPMTEQRRIVAKIEVLFSELDKGTENLQQARAKLAVYRQSLLKHAVEGKLSADWRTTHTSQLETADQLLIRIRTEREAHYQQQLTEWKKAISTGQQKDRKSASPTKPREDDLPEPISSDELERLPPLPLGWVWVKVAALGIVQLGRQRSPKNISRNHPTKYIRAANITEEGLNLEDVKEMEFLPHERGNYRLESGDLVLSEASGSPSQVGKPAVWRNQLMECCFQNTVIRLRPFIASSSDYLLAVFKYFYRSGMFAKIAGGVGINHLSATKFAAIPIPLAPLAEQSVVSEIVDSQLSSLAALATDIDVNLLRAEALRQSILKKAFAGELVPQDPADEPAETLLARMRAERSAAAATPRRAGQDAKKAFRKVAPSAKILKK